MSRINKIFFYLIVWITITSTAPFIFYLWPGHPYKILTFFGLLTMVTLFVFKTNKCLLIDRNILIILITQIIYFIAVSILYHNYSNLNYCIQLVALYVIITFIDNFIGFDHFSKSYIYIIMIMGIGGVITFFAHLIVGIPPIFSVKYSLSGATTYFLGLTCTNEYYHVMGIRIIRYSGFFDEPGAFALFSLFAIILNKIYFDDRKIEIYLIILTAFTFSLAFYIIIAVYLLLFYFRLSYFKYFILPIIGIIALSVSISNYKGDNGSIILLKQYTVDRFKINEKGTLSGNNRYESMVHDRKIFFQNPIMGVQREDQLKGISFFFILAKYGIFGSIFYYAFIIYFLFLILKLRGDRQISFLKILFVIVINFFNRPDFSAVFTLLVIYSMIKYVDFYSKESVTNRVLIY